MADSNQNGNQQQNTPDNQNQNSAGAGGSTASGAPEFDYEKLAALISGKQTVTEDTVLKSYFRECLLRR